MPKSASAERCGVPVVSEPPLLTLFGKDQCCCCWNCSQTWSWIGAKCGVLAASWFVEDNSQRYWIWNAEIMRRYYAEFAHHYFRFQRDCWKTIRFLSFAVNHHRHHHRRRRRLPLSAAQKKTVIWSAQIRVRNRPQGFHFLDPIVNRRFPGAASARLRSR